MSYTITPINKIRGDVVVEVVADSEAERSAAIESYKARYPTEGYGTWICGIGRNLEEGKYHAKIRRYSTCD